MADEKAGVPFERRLKRWARSERFPLSILVLAVGALLSVLAVGEFSPLGAGPPFQSINAVTDLSSSGGPNYDLIFVVLGPILVLIGAYLVGAYYVARRRFEHLMETRSKAEFLRNLPELEDLLWELTPNDELRYEDKKADLRIRR